MIQRVNKSQQDIKNPVQPAAITTAIGISLTLLFSQNVLSAGGGIITDDKSSLSSSARTEPYSPYAKRNFPNRPLWGDTHLHTAISFDAGAFGARLLPPDAYRFARGEEVISSTGQAAKLSRPLISWWLLIIQITWVFFQIYRPVHPILWPMRRDVNGTAW